MEDEKIHEHDDMNQYEYDIGSAYDENSPTIFTIECDLTSFPRSEVVNRVAKKYDNYLKNQSNSKKTASEIYEESNEGKQQAELCEMQSERFI